MPCAQRKTATVIGDDNHELNSAEGAARVMAFAIRSALTAYFATTRFTYRGTPRSVSELVSLLAAENKFPRSLGSPFWLPLIVVYSSGEPRHGR